MRNFQKLAGLGFPMHLLFFMISNSNHKMYLFQIERILFHFVYGPCVSICVLYSYCSEVESYCSEHLCVVHV